MRSGAAKRDFTEIQINNVVTLATRVRIQLLKVIYLDGISVFFNRS
jgi:hypothetical protein